MGAMLIIMNAHNEEPRTKVLCILCLLFWTSDESYNIAFPHLNEDVEQSQRDLLESPL